MCTDTTTKLGTLCVHNKVATVENVNTVMSITPRPHGRNIFTYKMKFILRCGTTVVFGYIEMNTDSQMHDIHFYVCQLHVSATSTYISIYTQSCTSKKKK